jgi:hypothetical protein
MSAKISPWVWNTAVCVSKYPRPVAYLSTRTNQNQQVGRSQLLTNRRGDHLRTQSPKANDDPNSGGFLNSLLETRTRPHYLLLAFHLTDNEAQLCNNESMKRAA